MHADISTHYLNMIKVDWPNCAKCGGLIDGNINKQRL